MQPGRRRKRKTVSFVFCQREKTGASAPLMMLRL